MVTAGEAGFAACVLMTLGFEAPTILVNFADLVTNDGVPAAGQAQGSQHRVDTLALGRLAHGARQPQLRRKPQRLPHRQALVQQVVLQQSAQHTAQSMCLL
jgi:hypothetical protein